MIVARLLRAGVPGRSLEEPASDDTGYSTRPGAVEARRTDIKRITPATIETTLAACALVSPKNVRGLMRIISIRYLAMPVSTRYAAKTIPFGAFVLKAHAPSLQRIQKIDRKSVV